MIFIIFSYAAISKTARRLSEDTASGHRLGFLVGKVTTLTSCVMYLLRSCLRKFTNYSVINHMDHLRLVK